ncbi:MAG: tyrosine-type recombinase/integrase [Anaerolineae bacterium]|nr:tyrosine-type recombinase/integrase [Anaerolineae bacterium]
MTEQWLTYLANQGRSESTIKQYRRGLHHFIRWSEQSYGQPFCPTAIIPRDVTDWISYQQTVERAKPATINQRLSALSQFFRWCLDNGHAKKDPTSGVSALRQAKRRPKALSKKYTRRLLRQVYQEENLRDNALIELLLGTGLRVSEALALTLADIELNERSGQVTVRRGKGGHQRTVPLTANVRKALNDYFDSIPLTDGEMPIWNGQRGPLRTSAAVYKLLKNYAFRAGLDPDLITPHVCRHTFATRFLENNPGDLRTLAAILGHGSLDTVMIYTEPTVSDLAERLERAA